MATETRLAGDQYSLVAASQTAQVLGGGHTGGRITGLLIVPATTSPGAVTLTDTSGSGTTFIIFTGGATSVTSLAPIFLGLNLLTSLSTGKWECTTGANVSVVAQGLWA